MNTAIADAVRDGRLPGRVWLYSNFRCNLVCTYCLTDSSPKSPGATCVVALERAGDDHAASSVLRWSWVTCPNGHGP